jgi:PAS domain S-box-containing protein
MENQFKSQLIIDKNKKTIKPQHVINKEVIWDKTQVIITKTDLYGSIEYANNTFFDVSGYEDYEIISQPHNIIRHHDMPKAIFKVLWDSIKSEKNFYGFVKNLAKSGRCYWVLTDFDKLKTKMEIL